MKLKNKRRIALATLIVACLLVPFFSLADFGPLNIGQAISESNPPGSVQPTTVTTALTFNEAYDFCFETWFPDWTMQQICMDNICGAFGGCVEGPDDTGLI